MSDPRHPYPGAAGWLRESGLALSALALWMLLLLAPLHAVAGILSEHAVRTGTAPALVLICESAGATEPEHPLPPCPLLALASALATPPISLQPVPLKRLASQALRPEEPRVYTSGHPRPGRPRDPPRPA